MADVKYCLTRKQNEAFEHLISEDKDDKGVYIKKNILYGGAKGGGKSFLFCLWVYYWCKHLIEFFDIKDIKYPIPVGFIGRKRSVDFSDTTLETWKKIIPNNSYVIREQDKEIVIEGKVKVMFGGLDNQETVNKFNSAELAFFGIDQAEETERAELSVLEASLRLTYKGKQPPYKIFYSANPAECWLKDAFITNPRPNHYFIPALPTDNPHLPDGYIQTLEDAFADDENLLRAYRDGDWDVLSNSNVLITSGMLEALKEVNHTQLRVDFRHGIAIDPATGGDECVLYYIKNFKIEEEKFLKTRDTMVIVAEAMDMSFRRECPDIGVDCIGLGAGVADRLAEKKLGRNVHYLNSSWSGKNISEPDRFFNFRTQMFWYAADLIRKGLIPYPVDPELRRQICAIKYRVINSSGKVQMASTTDIKKILLCSPDRACAYFYALWVCGHADPVQAIMPDRNTQFKLAIRKQLKKKAGEPQYVGM